MIYLIQIFVLFNIIKFLKGDDDEDDDEEDDE